MPVHPAQAAAGRGLTVETAMELVEKGVRHYSTEVPERGRRRALVFVETF